MKTSIIDSSKFSTKGSVQVLPVFFPGFYVLFYQGFASRVSGVQGLSSGAYVVRGLSPKQ